MLHEWLEGKTVEDLALIEHGGRMLFPDKIRRVKADGKFEDVKVLVRVPRTVELMDARRDARKFCKDRNIDPKEDADLFEQLDQMAVLARALRDPNSPQDQFQPLEFLLSNEPGKGFDTESLVDVWRRLEIYRKMIDPAVTKVSEDDVVRAAFAVARVQNLSPLVGIAGQELDSSIITMASMLASCLTQLQSSPSGETGSRVA
jgi:hypothetical protein